MLIEIPRDRITRSHALCAVTLAFAASLAVAVSSTGSAGLTFAFLLVVPAVVFGWTIPEGSPLDRVLVAAVGTLVVNGLVAAVLVTASISLRAGVFLVALISAAVLIGAGSRGPRRVERVTGPPIEQGHSEE